MTTPSETIRSRWLDALLPRIEAEGWSELAMKQAAEEAGITQGEQALAAPGGISDLREAFFDRAEAETRATVDAAELEEMRVHERVAFAVRAWLDELKAHRAAVRRASAYGFTPFGAGDAAQRCWSVADTVWDAIGDTSEDYNFYTKRALLASAIPSIVIYWQTAPSDADLDGFIARRLKTAMTLGRRGGQVLGPVLDAFSRRRGPDA